MYEEHHEGRSRVRPRRRALLHPLSQRTGKEVYEKVCIACHGTGVSGATKFGDKKWIELEKKEGMKRLVKEAIKGERAMPPKGGCSDCTEDEIRAAVKYLVDSAKKK